MLRIGRYFQYDAPDGWDESREGSRYYYHGPDGEELIISGQPLTGDGPPADILKGRAQLVENSLAVLREAATQDGLVPSVPVYKDDGITETECWVFVSESTDGQIVFTGAVAALARGTLLITMEGPHRPEVLTRFRDLLKPVRAPAN